MNRIENNIFDSKEFEQAYHTELPLGVLLTDNETEFRLWSPTASEVTLNLYADGHTSSLIVRCSMKPLTHGIWAFTIAEPLHGVYYDYSVTVDNVCRTTPDPYARAAGVNGTRSMVVNLRKTNPNGWELDKAPARPAENIIYEVHVKDFSNAVSSGVPANLRGKYLAFTQEHTTLNGESKTCLSYLKDLGVTHVQLMPVYDYGSVDEAGADTQYNWGYDPINYNVPEGSYSCDPYHGEVRIKELKSAIAALHRNGFRVIMDVVYNHTYSLDCALFKSAPWYFYRQNRDKSPSNGSACGNDVASERSMCARYIVDSVLYWAEEYHMDGFRFDLMGLLDVDLMNRIQQQLDTRFGEGEKLVFGEPWSATATAARKGTLLCQKENLKRLNPRIGAFCDATRDAVKGDLMDAHNKGAVNGGGLSATTLRSMLTGWAGNRDKFPVQGCSQSICYISAHDDWTLWDKLVYTMDAQTLNFKDCPERLLRANRLAVALYFCCQGHLFLLAGEEFARTKNGMKNSYSYSPAVNQMDWERCAQNSALVEYYRGFIALRKQLIGLCDKSELASYRIRTVQEIKPDCLTALVDNTVPPFEQANYSNRWSKLFLVFNLSQASTSVLLPSGNWELLADGANSFLWREPKLYCGSVTAAPVSALIFGKKEK